MPFIVSFTFFMNIGLQGLGSPFGNIISPSLSTCQIRRPSGGLQSCIVHNNLCCMAGILSLHMQNRIYWGFVWVPLRRYGSMDTLKSGTSSIIYGMTRMLFKSMYDFIKSGIVGNSSSCNFMLHCPKDASIWLCMWPTKRNNTNTSLKCLSQPIKTNMRRQTCIYCPWHSCQVGHA